MSDLKEIFQRIEKESKIVTLTKAEVSTHCETSSLRFTEINKRLDDLEEDIESIPGVLDAIITGGLEREIRVEPFADKLGYYSLSLTRLQTVIAAENQNVSGG